MSSYKIASIKLPMTQLRFDRNEIRQPVRIERLQLGIDTNICIDACNLQMHDFPDNAHIFPHFAELSLRLRFSNTMAFITMTRIHEPASQYRWSCS